MRAALIALMLTFASQAAAELILLDCAIEDQRIAFAFSIDAGEAKHLKNDYFGNEEMELHYDGDTISSYSLDEGLTRWTKKTGSDFWTMEYFAEVNNKDFSGTCYNAAWAVSQFSDVISNLDSDSADVDISEEDRFASCTSSAVTKLGAPFTLLNSVGQTVTSDEVVTEPSLLYFGYTFCPDVCPMDTFRNAEAVDILESRGQMITPVFISIDPPRDTPEVVGEFAENMHERMIGLTGSPKQVKAASQGYKTYFRAQKAEDDYYLVDHSTFSYLVLPKHGFVEFFRRDVSAETVADRISCFLK